MFLKIGKQRERKKLLYSSRKACSKSMYDVHRVQSLLEKFEDLDSLSLNYWLTQFVQEVANRDLSHNSNKSHYGAKVH